MLVRHPVVRGLSAAALLAFPGEGALAGPLTPPPGPVTSTGKTVQEIYDKSAAAEPRTAVNATNTPGSGAAQFVISQPGSYYLTANIVGMAGQSGILITASHATLDLNGFEVRGVASAVTGIQIAGNAVAVRNGVVDAWPTAGVSASNLQTGIVCEDLILRGNGQGIAISSPDSRVSNCTAISNTQNGINANGVSTQVSDCTASSNGGYGITLGNDAVARRCVARSNSQSGFNVIDNAEVYDSHALSNTGDGFAAAFGCNLVRCTAIANTVWGFNVLRSCRVMDCYARAHTNPVGDGIGMQETSTICSGNTCEINARGIVATFSNNTIIRNNVVGGTTAFSLVAGNRVGTIVSPTASGAISGGFGGGLGTTDPFANFAY